MFESSSSLLWQQVKNKKAMKRLKTLIFDPQAKIADLVFLFELCKRWNIEHMLLKCFQKTNIGIF